MMNEEEMLNPRPYPTPSSDQHHMLVNDPQTPMDMPQVPGEMLMPPGTMLYASRPPIIFTPPLFSRNAQNVHCHVCERSVLSHVSYEAGSGAYTMGAIILVMGGALLCCLIPCCVDDCQDAIHSCPFCNNFLGRKNYLFN